MMDDENSTIKVILIIVIIAILAFTGWFLLRRSSNNTVVDDSNNNTVKDNVSNAVEDTKNNVSNAVEDTKNNFANAADKAEDKVSEIITNYDENNTENVEISNGEKINNSKALLTDKKYKNVIFSKPTLKGKNTGATFSVKVSNESTEAFEKETVKIKFLDKSGKQIGSLDLKISDIDAGSSTQVSETVMSDIANAYDYTVE